MLISINIILLNLLNDNLLMSIKYKFLIKINYIYKILLSITFQFRLSFYHFFLLIKLLLLLFNFIFKLNNTIFKNLNYFYNKNKNKFRLDNFYLINFSCLKISIYFFTIFLDILIKHLTILIFINFIKKIKSFLDFNQQLILLLDYNL